MARKPINSPDEYVETGNLRLRCWTPEALALQEQKFSLLEALFPIERCREMVKLTLAEIAAQHAHIDPVFLPDFDEKELDNPAMPEEFKEFARVHAGKHSSELPPPTPEQEAEYLEDETGTAVDLVVGAWLNALHYALKQSGNKPVRLDSLLLPPPELLRHEGLDLCENLVGSIALTIEQIRELRAIYAAKLITYLESEFITHPDGFTLVEDILICKDENGFYLLPEIET